MIKNSKIKNPKMVFIHGDNPVRKANLKPLYEETKRRRIDAVFVKEAKKFGRDYENYINIAVHNKDLKNALGYNIHLDHGPRGKGTGNFEYAVKDYKDNGYFPFVHLHITAGEYGDEETKKLLGPYRDRTVIVGYPKGDDLLRCNTKENKELAYKKFKFDRNKILITYAPAGKKSYISPGGSLSEEVIGELSEIALKFDHNILVKLRCSKPTLFLRALKKLKNIFKLVRLK